jgi:hypothetical protein
VKGSFSVLAKRWSPSIRCLRGALQLGAAEELAAQAREIQDERDALRHHEERARRLESAVQMYAKQVLANRSMRDACCLLLTW